jgi:hypothetical protein
MATPHPQNYFPASTQANLREIASWPFSLICSRFLDFRGFQALNRSNQAARTGYSWVQFEKQLFCKSLVFKCLELPSWKPVASNLHIVTI